MSTAKAESEPRCTECGQPADDALHADPEKYYGVHPFRPGYLSHAEAAKQWVDLLQGIAAPPTEQADGN